MVVVFENREYSDVIGNRQAPYFNSLASRFALADKSFGVHHPSLPNYLELISGSTLGITDDCTTCSAESTTIADQLSAKGVSWRAYMEGIDGPCSTEETSQSGYAKRHNPFAYIRHIAHDSAQCNREVPLTSFATDIESSDAAPFMWVSPNVCDDGHDCSIAQADKWLSDHIGPVLESTWYKDNGIVVVTFDEGTSDASCCGTDAGGHIPTLVISSLVKPGARLETPINHAGVLRTIEDLYGLNHLGDASCDCSGSFKSLLG